MTKVFGLGLNKTGTTSLGAALQQLGYRTRSYDFDLLREYRVRNNTDSLIDSAQHADAFDDIPWCLVYKELDEAFPGSKFVLTRRSSAESWLNSVQKHAMRSNVLLTGMKLIYGYSFPVENPTAFLSFYEEHNNRVREYFKGRPESMIELCWEEGDSWKELCNFLDVPAPSADFPHERAGNKQRGWRYEVRKIINSALLKFPV